jgi:hypothetical protein
MQVDDVYQKDENRIIWNKTKDEILDLREYKDI